MDITVIILSLNRHYYLKRAINYWKGKDIRLLIIDGSHEPLNINNSEFNNINYFHLKKNFHERIKFAIKNIKTEYSILSADDDFILENSLKNFHNILLSKSDIKFCSGKSLSFNFKNKKIFYVPTYTKDANNFNSDPLKRLLHLSNNYVPSSIYSLTSTSNFKFIWDLVLKNKLNLWGEIEIQYEIFSAYFGKRENINQISLLRSNEVETVTSDDKSMSGVTVGEYWLKSNEIERINLCKSIKNSINKNDDQLTISLVNFFNNYTKKTIKPIYKNFKLIRNIIPSKLKSILIKKFDLKLISINDIEYYCHKNKYLFDKNEFYYFENFIKEFKEID